MKFKIEQKLLLTWHRSCRIGEIVTGLNYYGILRLLTTFTEVLWSRFEAELCAEAEQLFPFGVFVGAGVCSWYEYFSPNSLMCCQVISALNDISECAEKE